MHVYVYLLDMCTNKIDNDNNNNNNNNKNNNNNNNNDILCKFKQVPTVDPSPLLFKSQLHVD